MLLSIRLEIFGCVCVYGDGDHVCTVLPHMLFTHDSLNARLCMCGGAHTRNIFIYTYRLMRQKETAIMYTIDDDVLENEPG